MQFSTPIDPLFPIYFNNIAGLGLVPDIGNREVVGGKWQIHHYALLGMV